MRPSVDTIIAAVAAHGGVTVDQVLGRRRPGPVIEVRHRAYWMVRRLLPMLPLGEIGRRFGRDQTTVLHGVRKHDARLRTEAAERETCELLARLICAPFDQEPNLLLEDGGRASFARAVIEARDPKQPSRLTIDDTALLQAALGGLGLFETAAHAAMKPGDVKARARRLAEALAALAGGVAIFPEVRVEAVGDRAAA
ncbi:MAG: helix-turn-helix domain-containing protein [Caulobacteraceae bacterium]